MLRAEKIPDMPKGQSSPVGHVDILGAQDNDSLVVDEHLSNRAIRSQVGLEGSIPLQVGSKERRHTALYRKSEPTILDRKR